MLEPAGTDCSKMGTFCVMRISRIIACACICLALGSAPALDREASGRPEACTGLNRLTGKSASVLFIDRPRRFGGFHAQAQWDTAGNPIIFLNGEYFEANRTVRKFIARHECCHHESFRTAYLDGGSTYAASGWSPDEVEANCCALAALGRRDVAKVERWLMGLRVLPPQYGGSGPALWSATRKTCPTAAGGK